MKIILIDKEHNFRLVPDSAQLLKNRPFFRPDYVENLHAKIAIVIKINRLGKYIQEKFASNYYDEVGLALNFYDKKCLEALIQKGLPWERACCFDGAFALSEFVKITDIAEFAQVCVSQPHAIKQSFEIYSLLQKIPKIISELSTCMTLKTGDYIALELGDLESVPLALNDVLCLSLNECEMLRVMIK